MATANPMLPNVLPVFPIGGAVLLPRGVMPLNIFEPRYLAMVRDAMAGDKLIGMIQPRLTADDGGEPARRRHACSASAAPGGSPNFTKPATGG